MPFTPATATLVPNPSTVDPPPSAHFAPPESDEYEAGLTVIGEFDTVETFCRYFNWLKPPSKLERNSNYHLMKNNGALLDRCWAWLAMALVGEDLDEGDEIKEDVEKINGIGRKMAKLLDVSEADGIGLEFQYNNDDRPVPNKFLSIQALPQTSYRTSFHAKSSPVSGPGESGAQFPAAGPGGAFAGFGVGGGAIGSGWRGKR